MMSKARIKEIQLRVKSSGKNNDCDYQEDINCLLGEILKLQAKIAKLSEEKDLSKGNVGFP
jgi:hypothetical protein